MEILVYLFIAFVIFIFIKGAKGVSEDKKKGIYRIKGGYERLDRYNYGDGTLHHDWHMMGYIWHEKWKRWVPDITKNANEYYWGKKGYKWDKKRGRWLKY